MDLIYTNTGEELTAGDIEMNNEFAKTVLFTEDEPFIGL